jgi:hypothetical protein
VNAYRFSIAWPRVIPLGGRNDPINEKGVQFYSDLIDELLKHNITPFVVSDTSSIAPALIRQTLYQFVQSPFCAYHPAGIYPRHYTSDMAAG